MRNVKATTDYTEKAQKHHGLDIPFPAYTKGHRHPERSADVLSERSESKDQSARSRRMLRSWYSLRLRLDEKHEPALRLADFFLQANDKNRRPSSVKRRI